jgi:hypothetical protein
MCNSFHLYRQQSVDFFMQRLTGMTRPVAEYLTSKVFCILDDLKDDSQRVEARDFGIWIKDLPALLADTSASVHKRAVLTQGFPIAASPPPPLSPGSPIDTLETFAIASQTLAGETSKASRSLKHRGDIAVEVPDAPPMPVMPAPPIVTKKASKWKLEFGKNSSSGLSGIVSKPAVYRGNSTTA